MFEYQVVFAAKMLVVSFTHVDDGEMLVVRRSSSDRQNLGLLPGDVLVAINGKSVSDFSISAFDILREHCTVCPPSEDEERSRSFLIGRVEQSFSASFRRLEDGDA